jgi:hypothetical protein
LASQEPCLAAQKKAMEKATVATHWRSQGLAGDLGSIAKQPGCARRRTPHRLAQHLTGQAIYVTEGIGRCG